MRAEGARPATPGRIQWALVHEVGAVAVLLMETTLIVPWFRSLTAHTQALTTSGALGLLLGAAVLAMVLVRASQALRLAAGIRRAVLLAALAVCLLGALRIVIYRGARVGVVSLIIASLQSFDSVLTLVPSELVVILAVLYAWRRGVVVASMDVLSAGWAARRLRIGILVHTAFALIFGAAGAGRLLEVLPLTFAGGLAGVAMSRADSLPRLRGAGRSPFAGEWMAGILGLVAATVGIGLGAAGALTSPPAVRFAAWLGEKALDAAEILLQLARPLVLGIATLLDRFVAWLLAATDFRPTLIRLQEALPRAATPTPEPPTPIPWLETYAAPLQIVLTTLLIVALALIVVRVSRRPLRAANAPPADRSDALRARRPGLPALRGILTMAHLGLERARRFGRRSLAEAAVRRIYARLLGLAEARGRARAPAETPREFVVQLRALFPRNRNEVELITEEYLRVRYGEYPEAAEAVARVRAAWQSVLHEARGRPGD